MSGQLLIVVWNVGCFATPAAAAVQCNLPQFCENVPSGRLEVVEKCGADRVELDENNDLFASMVIVCNISEMEN